jgi:hypothetical protein
VLLVLLWPGGGAPAVVGLTLTQAQALAEDAGMTVDVTSEVPSFDEQADIVLEQDPAPEAEAEDDVLRVTVTREPTPVAVNEIQDYDPEGDETENPDTLSNMIDGKDGTSWTTELYRSAEFGGLKSGVGFDFTLEEAATIIEIVSPVEGWKGELLQNIESGTAARLATLDGDANQIITLRETITSGRMWFTELAKLTEDRWGVEISELRFYR